MTGSRRRWKEAVLALLAAAFLAAGAAPLLGGTRQIVLLPTVNYTGFEVWESRYYPVNVLEQRMTEHLAMLLRQEPFTDVSLLSEAEASWWFSNPSRPGTFAIRMELYSALSKEREALGTFEQGKASLRVRVYDGLDGNLILARETTGKDQRYTFNPGDDRLYFWTARDLPLFDVLHKDGLDLLRLAPGDKGPKMSRPTWQQFSSTSTWQAFMNAIRQAADGIAALDRDDLRLTGRILAPRADATARRRTYIISLGLEDGLAQGDVLQVLRGDTYVTVDPENPVVVLPRIIGNVRVIETLPSEAVVLLINENRDDPVQLNDLVTAPRYGEKKVAPLR
ncbi:MAG: hypothetical protein JMJ93_10320 [Synergistaceae bacterium]|nr:hypothetical protein [Synergistaceae bacterium]